MALIACKECNNEVSTEARTCPKCGAKVVEPKKPMSTTTKILIGLFGFGVLAMVVSESGRKEDRENAEKQRIAALTPEQKTKEKADKSKRNLQLQMAEVGASTLKKSMKDPTAFDLTSLTVLPNGSACYEYRAKNSFGAIFPASAVLTKGKLLVSERDGNNFVEVWNKECTVSGGDEIAASVKRLGIL